MTKLKGAWVLLVMTLLMIVFMGLTAKSQDTSWSRDGSEYTVTPRPGDEPLQISIYVPWFAVLCFLFGLLGIAAHKIRNAKKRNERYVFEWRDYVLPTCFFLVLFTTYYFGGRELIALIFQIEIKDESVFFNMNPVTNFIFGYLIENWLNQNGKSKTDKLNLKGLKDVPQSDNGETEPIRASEPK